MFSIWRVTRTKLVNLNVFRDKRSLITVEESENLQKEEWYRISKLWLGKIFKKDNMSQNEIDDQIKYLLPSALLFRDARPSLSMPGCLVYNSKDLFDKNGNVKSHGYFMNTPGYSDMIYVLQNSDII